jgi:hypothetical protein
MKREDVKREKMRLTKVFSRFTFQTHVSRFRIKFHAFPVTSILGSMNAYATSTNKLSANRNTE